MTLVVGPNVKVQSYVILVLLNVIMKLSNVRKKKGITECNKSMVWSDVDTA